MKEDDWCGLLPLSEVWMLYVISQASTFSFKLQGERPLIMELTMEKFYG